MSDPRIQDSWAPSDRYDERPSTSYRQPSPPVPRDDRSRGEARTSRGDRYTDDPEPGQITDFTTWGERQRQANAARPGLPQKPPPSYRDPRPRSPSPPLRPSDRERSRRTPPISHGRRSPNPSYNRSRDVRSRSPPSRHDDRREDKGKGKATSSFDAMSKFTLTMQSTLLSTTAHFLARERASRLESFPSVSANHPSLVDAREKLVEAEDQLWSQKVQLQQAFAELLRQTAEKGAATLDLDEIRARLERLENRQGQPLPPPVSAPPDPPPTPAGPTQDVEMGDASERRASAPVKLKDAVKDIMKRLSAVESAKLDMDEKCQDLEELIWSQAEERVEERMSWGRLERSRISQRKRRRPESDAEEQATPVVEGSQVTAEEPPVSLAAKLPSTIGASNELDTNTVTRIAQLEVQVKALMETVVLLKQGNPARDRAIVQAAIQGMRAEYTDTVRKELQKVAQSYEKRNAVPVKANAPGQANGYANGSLQGGLPPAGLTSPLQIPQGSPQPPQNALLNTGNFQPSFGQAIQNVHPATNTTSSLSPHLSPVMPPTSVPIQYPTINPYGPSGQSNGTVGQSLIERRLSNADRAAAFATQHQLDQARDLARNTTHGANQPTLTNPSGANALYRTLTQTPQGTWTLNTSTPGEVSGGTWTPQQPPR
ncbi:hypothetical protein BD324DRAFT_613872 [Kockovaella imperatae]|uniref:Uncharacterized protein n=1 Tax=Kockovaella imperatae TaxID=4999 RepID=A0A1Y1UUW3_9TREE|nr:hypothetical protein BD324DRAFT_613872 [Kockovaella imperatae]ORX41266.1 hypothetical protein BD324DRAFT_613872 [Kockovaella imperatae]